MGALQNPSGSAISISGLWALQVGNGKSGGDANAVYFTAGPGGEQHGLFGSLQAAPVLLSAGPVLNGADFWQQRDRRIHLGQRVRLQYVIHHAELAGQRHAERQAPHAARRRQCDGGRQAGVYLLYQPDADQRAGGGGFHAGTGAGVGSTRPWPAPALRRRCRRARRRSLFRRATTPQRCTPTIPWWVRPRSYANNSTPAAPGETIMLFATGFGPAARPFRMVRSSPRRFRLPARRSRLAALPQW